jgi:hypothetical protein
MDTRASRRLYESIEPLDRVKLLNAQLPVLDEWGGTHVFLCDVTGIGAGMHASVSGSLH